MSPTLIPPLQRQEPAGLRAEWRRVTRVLADPPVELDADTVTPLLACHRRMTSAGIRIDPMANALVPQLGYQLADAEAYADG